MARRPHPIQRLAAYGVYQRDDTILLVRASNLTEVAGRWFLPGGGVEHGEHPMAALEREITEETGLVATIGAQLGIISDVRTRRDGTKLHSVRIIYSIDHASGELCDEATGSSDLAAFVTLDEARSMPVAFYAVQAMAMAGIDIAPTRS